MPLGRPDLSKTDPEIRAYIESLEAELERLSRGRGSRVREVGPADEEPESTIPLEVSEAPTTLSLVTMTASGVAKRTLRHLYTRQRRGGMGIFDLETGEDEPPTILTIVDEGRSLILLTNLARAFRLPLSAIPEAPVRGKGQSVIGRLGLQPGEHITCALPDQAKGAVAMVSERGWVRSLRHHVFGEYMKPGTSLFDPKNFGPLMAACWSPGESDLFIATRQGRAIRFSDKLVPPQGGPGIRLEPGDLPAAITAVDQDSSVFMMAEDGRGTIRLMEGFNANKSAGGSGKIAMNTDGLVCALTVSQGDDIFAISRLSKIIRFMAAEVPAKEGVVQGVNCMALRADKVTAVTLGSII